MHSIAMKIVDDQSMIDLNNYLKVSTAFFENTIRLFISLIAQDQAGGSISLNQPKIKPKKEIIKLINDYKTTSNFIFDSSNEMPYFENHQNQLQTFPEIFSIIIKLDCQ